MGLEELRDYMDGDLPPLRIQPWSEEQEETERQKFLKRREGPTPPPYGGGQAYGWDLPGSVGQGSMDWSGGLAPGTSEEDPGQRTGPVEGQDVDTLAPAEQ